MIARIAGVQMLMEVLLDIGRAFRSRRKGLSGSTSTGSADLHQQFSFYQSIPALWPMPVTRELCDEILHQCADIERRNPYIPSGFKWILDYKRFEVEKVRGNLNVAAN